jgi:cytochrome c oxidase subunit 2
VVGLGLYSVVVFQDMGGFAPGGHHHSGMMMAQAPQHEMVDVGSPMLAQAGEGGARQVYGFGASPMVEGNRPDLTVNVTGMQYAWIFRYPDTGIVDGELHVPVGQDVQLLIEAQDVIHSFWVPQFRLKQDALPGQPAELRFVATKEGTYPVVCAELCGAYHGGMRTQVIVHSLEDYAAWEASRVAELPGAAETVAVNPATMTDADYLAQIAQDIPIEATQIAQLTPPPKP